MNDSTNPAPTPAAPTAVSMPTTPAATEPTATEPATTPTATEPIATTPAATEPTATTPAAIDADLMSAIEKAQMDEEIGAAVYAFMAQREKDPRNKELLEQMAADEKLHAETWARITGRQMSAPAGKLFRLKMTTRILGFTFVMKSLEKDEQMAQSSYEKMVEQLPQAAQMLDDERRHEAEIEGMLDEERLHYVGAMVLGLNDALVELTGAIAGVTFALADTKLVAMTGIITGVSATLSMAASNFLAERAEGHDDAMKSSVYTGIAYIVTVVLMVLPYLLFPNDMYVAAFFVMIAIVVAIIAFFNYYLSVAKEEPFRRRFGEMTAISLSVAVISYLIGIAAKALLGIDV